MTSDDAKRVLRCPYKPLALLALTYVNLTDRELNTLVLRHMRGLTQEETAEALDRSKNTIQTWESEGLDRCAKAWSGLAMIEEILNTGST